MTYQEITDKYRELFVMLVEIAGKKTGNSSYLEVAKVLDEPGNKDAIERAIEDEVDFKIFVTLLIYTILEDIYKTDTLITWDGETAGEKVAEFYTEFLKTATRRFCSKYGLEAFDDPGTAFRVVSHKFRNNND